MIRIHSADESDRRGDIADQLAEVITEIHRRIRGTHPFTVSDVCGELDIDFDLRESA